jgi:L-alanine-DL-glutamate epimerase-like enolase superfamily enzyme
VDWNSETIWVGTGEVNASRSSYAGVGVLKSSDKGKTWENLGLKDIQPQYIILKPSFVGGFRGTQEWITLADKYKIGWWITSALESNIGLNAIAQWTYLQKSKMPQGLGTGALYTNNFDCPLEVEKGQLWYRKNSDWYFDKAIFHK